MGTAPKGSNDQVNWSRVKTQVQEANPDLQDALDVSAVIESLGWTDRRIEETFGYPDVFSMAQDLYDELHRDVTSKPLPIEVRISRQKLIFSIIRDVGHGLTFTLPMVVSVMAMITLHITFSSYQYFSVSNATAIALATFLSFLTTGGFSQAMTNVYYILLGMQKTGEIEAAVFQLLRWGLWMTLGTCGALLIIDFIFPIMPFHLIGLMILYTIMLSALWLSFTGLYILRREYFLTVITAIAIGVAYVLYHHGIAVQWAQAVAMLVASLLSLSTSLVIFRRRTKGLKTLPGLFKTRMPQLLHTASPYFLYGVLYFVFIYTDRLVAWSSQTTFLPYNIWFRGQYELGMDWSLIALFLPLSLAEVLISSIMRQLEHLEHRTALIHTSQLFHKLRWKYAWSLGFFVLSSVVGVIFAHFAVSFLAPTRLFHTSVPVFGVEPFVFAWSSWSYVLFSVALFNVLLLFTLSYPRPALKVLGYGVLTDVVSGIAATQILNGYQFAVLGLFASAIVMAVYSSGLVLGLLPRTDYLLFRLT